MTDEPDTYAVKGYDRTVFEAFRETKPKNATNDEFLEALLTAYSEEEDGEDGKGVGGLSATVTLSRGQVEEIAAMSGRKAAGELEEKLRR